MSVDVRQPFAEFLYSCLAEYRLTLNGAAMSRKMWEEEVARAHAAWHAAHKPKKKVRIEADADWIKSLKEDPNMAGVDVDKELAKCRFWCKGQTPPVLPTRRRVVNWLNRADRVVGAETTRAPLPRPGPEGWVAWAREELPQWRRFEQEKNGVPIPAWHLLEPSERQAIESQMKRGAAK